MRSERSYYDTIPSGVKVTYRILSKSVCGGQTRTVGDSSCVEVEASPQTGSGDGTTYFYITDHLGTVRAILDVDGNIKSTHDFEPFGVELQPLSAESTNFHYKYTGQERDSSTNLDYMHARFYGSLIGRFLSPDPVNGNPTNPQSWNLYSYVNGNPVNFNDPSGHMPPADNTVAGTPGIAKDNGEPPSLGGIYEDVPDEMLPIQITLRVTIDKNLKKEEQQEAKAKFKEQLRDTNKIYGKLGIRCKAKFKVGEVQDFEKVKMDAEKGKNKYLFIKRYFMGLPSTLY